MSKLCMKFFAILCFRFSFRVLLLIFSINDNSSSLYCFLSNSYYLMMSVKKCWLRLTFISISCPRMLMLSLVKSKIVSAFFIASLFSESGNLLIYYLEHLRSCQLFCFLFELLFMLF